MGAGEKESRGVFFVLLGLVLNTLLALIKGVAGVLGNSQALLADAVESAADIFGSLIAWTGLAIASRPPDENHPYGHGKAEPLSAVVISLMLMGAGTLVVIQSVAEIITPHTTPAPFTLAVLVGVVVLKEGLYRFLIREGKRELSLILMGDAWHHRSDALTSLAAFLGISLSLIGGKGYETLDDWAALFASGVIFFNAVTILKSGLNELMDEAPHPLMEERVRKVAQGVEGVIALEKCFVRKMGTRYYVDLHVTVEGGLTVREGHDIASHVRDTIQREIPQVAGVLVHIEPSDLLHAPARRGP